jgi:hypothetical protein
LALDNDQNLTCHQHYYLAEMGRVSESVGHLDGIDDCDVGHSLEAGKVALVA